MRLKNSQLLSFCKQKNTMKEKKKENGRKKKKYKYKENGVGERPRR